MIKGEEEGCKKINDRERLSEMVKKKEDGIELKWKRKKRIDVAKGRDRLSERKSLHLKVSEICEACGL